MKKARWVSVVFIFLLLSTVPQPANAQDSGAPGETVLTEPAGDDALLPEGTGERFSEFSNSSYDPINLSAGWNQVGVLPMTRFFYEGGIKDGSDITGPSDLQYVSSYATRAEMLQAAFGIDPDDWSKVESIQMVYPESASYGYGPVLSYTRGLDDHFNTLDFVLTGYSAWIKVDSAITLTPVQPAGPQPLPAP